MKQWVKAFLSILVFGVRIPVVKAGSSCVLNQHSAEPHIVMEDLTARFPEIAQKIQKGLTVNLVTQTFLATSFRGEEVSVHCRIYADLWNELVVVSRTTFKSETFSTPQKFKTLADGIRLCQEVELPASARGLSGLDVVTILNPVSAEQVEKTRKWLAERGIGASAGPMLGRAVGALLDLNDQKMVRRFCPAE